jgi:hypothetical protein
VVREFRREHEIIAASGDELAYQLLGLPYLVTVGGVQKVAARLDVAVEDALRLIRCGSVAPASAKSAAAQGELGDSETGAASEGFVAHGGVP